MYGLYFPLAFHPGLVLYCNVESGGSVVRIRTEPVTPPLVASNGTRFDYDTTMAVYERELGLKPLPTAQRRDAPSLTELINRALRQRGRVREDGGRALNTRRDRDRHPRPSLASERHAADCRNCGDDGTRPRRR